MACKSWIIAIGFVLCTISVVQAADSTKCRSDSKPNEDDITEPSVNTTKPEKPFNRRKERLRSSQTAWPKDFKEVLTAFKCHCYKRGKTNPGTLNHSFNTCPAVDHRIFLGQTSWGCWVHYKFQNHYCPYTTCKQFGKCQGVQTKFGNAYCVQAQYKTVVYYAWCWNGRWELKKLRLGLPTCCSCRWYC